MAVQITIREVPNSVRDALAARAAARGVSMEEFLRKELQRLASLPSPEAWLEQVRRRKRATGSRVAASAILEQRNAERR